MKTLVWTGPRQFDLRDETVPELRDGDALVKVAYAGICGSELSGYLGTNSLRKPPLVMGHEFSGTIVQVRGSANHSPDGSAFNVGDLVTANPIVPCGRCDNCRRGMLQFCPNREFIGVNVPGGFAEYVRVPMTALRKVHDAVAGALVEPLACSLRSVRQSGLVIGDAVVVFGAGIIGLFAMRIAELSGASLRILVDNNSQRLALGRDFGATHVVNPREQDVVEAITKLAGGKVHRVIDAVGAPIVRQQALAVVAIGGSVVFIGLHDDETEIPGNWVVRNEIKIVGSFAYDYDDFARAHNLLESGVVGHDGNWLDIRPLEAAKAAFDEQIEGVARFPKIMLSPA